MQPLRLLRPSSKPAWFRQQRRLSLRLATGMSPGQVARAEGVAEAELTALLAEPDFAALVAAYKALEALDAATRLARLEQLAMGVLEEAMVRDDTRVALFILSQCRAGLNPARTVAERIVRSCQPAPVPKPRTIPRRPRPPRPYDAVANALRQGAARACNLVLAEQVVRVAVAKVTAAKAATVPPAPAKPTASAQPAPTASDPRPAPRGGWPNGP